MRLGPTTERALNALAKRKRVSRSDVVREALIRYGAEEGVAPTRISTPRGWTSSVVNLGACDPARTTGEQLFAALLRKGSRAQRAR